MNHSKIPVLMYHKITPSREVGVTTLHPNRFESQIKYLFDNGYRTVDSSSDYSKKSIIITFDDAYESVFKYAYPILKKYNYTATVFPIFEFIGKSNSWDANLMGIRFKHMDLRQLKLLIKNGWEIGAHTKSHNIDKIKKNLKSEVSDCKSKLEQLLSTEVKCFAYPFGYKNAAIKRHVEQSYKTAFAASFHSKEDYYFRARIPIYSFDSLNRFKRKLKMNKYDLKLSNMIHQASYATILYQNLKSTIMEG